MYNNIDCHVGYSLLFVISFLAETLTRWEITE